MAKYNWNNVTDPESAVSIGAWSLLADLRQILCRRLALQAQLLGNLDPSLIQRLIKDSSGYWSGVSTTDATQGAKLVEYLNTEAARVPGLREKEEWALLFERLIVPYVISVTDDLKVHPWFPDTTFLGVYYQEFGQPDDAARPTVPLFLTEETIAQLRQAGGTYQDLLPPADSLEHARSRFASGMRALQSKLIGAFEHVVTQESRPIDLLVGNGSALMYAIQDDSGPPLGLICFSSPVIGLYHEILLPPDVKKLLPEERFRHSIYICPAVLDGNDRVWAESLAEADSPSDPQAEATPSVSHVALEGTTVGTIDLLVCRTCKGGKAQARCAFAGIDSWLYPMLGTFLGGLKQVAARAELEPLQKYAATLSHVLHTPIATIATTFHYHIDKLSPDKAELKASFGNLASGLFVLYAMAESTRRHFKLERQGTSDLLGTSRLSPEGEQSTNLLEIVEELESSPIFEKLFQMGIDLSKHYAGTPVPVGGYKGDWYVILYTLLKNAFGGADRFFKSGEGAASPASVTLKLLYPDDATDTFSLELRNPSVALPQDLLLAMRQCLMGKLSRIPQDIYRRNSGEGFGVGLGLVGDIISADGFAATVEQDAESLEVVVRINNVPVR